MIEEKSAVASAYTMEGQSWPGGGDQSLPVLWPHTVSVLPPFQRRTKTDPFLPWSLFGAKPSVERGRRNNKRTSQEGTVSTTREEKGKIKAWGTGWESAGGSSRQHFCFRTLRGPSLVRSRVIDFRAQVHAFPWCRQSFARWLHGYINMFFGATFSRSSKVSSGDKCFMFTWKPRSKTAQVFLVLLELVSPAWAYLC